MNILPIRGTIFCVILSISLFLVRSGYASNIFGLRDLVGTWEFNSLASGPGAPWWERGPLTVDSNGLSSGTLEEYPGQPDIWPSTTFNISPDGIITFVGNSIGRCTMDSGKTIIACTATWSTGDPGTTTINVWPKKDGSYSMADLVGTWEVNALASGPGAPWWERGALEISSNGSVSGTMEEYQSDPDNWSGTLNISNDGIITLVGNSIFRCAMDSDKTIVACTDTWSTGSPGTSVIHVWTKKGDSYSLADLAGKWESNSLASGPGAPWWERGVVTVNPDGSFIVSTTESDGSTGGSLSGTFNISADGIITMVGDPAFRGSMDSGKTVMVFTDTWSTGSPGTTEIKVVTKKASNTIPYFLLLSDAAGGSNCDSSDVTLCSTSGDCTAAGGYWWSDNTCLGVPAEETVTSAGGRIWMDRNLGASQVAESSTDEAAYGDLYQWGRGTDGHQLRTSSTTSTTSSTDDPGHGNFITHNFDPPIDWRIPQNDSLWQGVSGTNNPCPSGFRIPTAAEWETERSSWGSNDSAVAFSSPLKLVLAGNRYQYDGTLSGVGTSGAYWSSAVDGVVSFLYFGSGYAGVSNGEARALGYSVRCIKD